MAITKVYLTQYSASVDDSPVLLLGTKESYGNEQLQIIRSPEWEDLIITATFAAGDTPLASPVLVPEDGLIDVPAGATAERLPLEECGVITFCGVADGVQRISTSLPYLVSDHGPVEGTVPAPTPSEWEQFVARTKADADRAEQGAADAENAANAAKESLDEIGTAVEDAESAAAAAEQSAKDAAAELGKVEDVGTEALKGIDAARVSAVSAVGTAGTQAQQDVGAAEETALDAISDAKNTATHGVQQAGTAEVGKVNDAGATQIKAVQDEGAEQVQAVTEAGDAQAQRMEALVPDVYAKAESDARYAPMEAAIKVSGKGTGLVSLSPTVAWKPQGLKLYGRSWQDGTPSVETEVPIQDAGQSGQVDVTVCGANLFDLSPVNIDLMTKHNVSILGYSDGLSFESTGDDAYVGNVVSAGITAGSGSLQLAFEVEPKKKYSISLSDTSLVKNFVTFLDKNNVCLSSSNFTTKDYYFLTPDGCVKVALRIGTGNAPIGTKVDTTIMVNVGDIPKPYQHYTAQKIVVQTPDGLPGIPVTSGGNWTDETGQQWVSDVVDLAAGTKTQAIYRLRKEDMTAVQVSSAYAVIAVNVPTPNTQIKKALCSITDRFFGSWNNDTDHYFLQDGYQKVVICGKGWASIADAQAAIDAGIEFIYPLAIPVATTLDNDTISAYTALQSYSGTTNVLAPDCGIEATAVGDAHQIIANITQKVAALESAATGI